MTGSGDYYEVLGVPRDAGTETIKAAFRRLARRYHPDISTDPDAEQRFKEIAEAYGVLSDPARRASYDAQGTTGLAGATAEDLWGGIDFTGIFGSGAAAFGNLFERLFGPAAAAPARGQDVRLDLEISLDEVLTGGNHTVTIRRPGPCPQCAGSGSEPGTAPRRCPGCGGTGQRAMTSRHGPLLVRPVAACPQCGGRGLVTGQPCPACAASGTAMREETVTIGIPPGIPEGAALRLAGRGMPSPVPGAPPGDAYVSIRTRADSRFTRAGADLWHNLRVQAPDAALGVTTAVPVPGGQARVRVPPGTQPGSVLRVAGKGLPRYGGHGHGSLNLTVTLDIPQHLSPRQRQLYEQLRAEDAGIKSAAGRSGEPDAPRSGRRMTAGLGGWHAAGRGLLIFASVLLLVAGIANLIAGAPLGVRRLARLGLGHGHLGRRAAGGGCGGLGGQANAVIFHDTAVKPFRWQQRSQPRPSWRWLPAIQRRSISRPSGTTTHKNHGPPLAPPSSQITKATTLIVSQNRQAACHARTDPPAGTCTGPGARRSGSRVRSVPGRSAIRRSSSPRVVAA